MHPQNLLVGWVGVLGATSFAQGWDHFASAYSARAAGSVSPHAASPSLALWVVSSAEGLSEGQRPFERVVQLRAIEKERGFAFTFQKLPPVAQDYLERARLGAEHWVAQHSQKWPASPLVQSLAGRSLHPPPPTVAVPSLVSRTPKVTRPL